MVPLTGLHEYRPKWPHSWCRLQVSMSTGRSGRHQGNLLEDMGGRRLLGSERQLEVIDDPIHDGVLREEGDDLHPAAAPGTDHRVDLIDLADHLGPDLPPLTGPALKSRDEPSARHSPVAYIHGRVRRNWTPGQARGRASRSRSWQGRGPGRCGIFKPDALWPRAVMAERAMRPAGGPAAWVAAVAEVEVEAGVASGASGTVP